MLIMFRLQQSMIYIVFYFLLASLEAFSKCPDSGQFAGYECAKAGDNFASVGDFKNAISSWKKSCDFGIDSSCRLLNQYENKKTDFERDFSIKGDLSFCNPEKIQVEKCFAIAKKNEKNNEVLSKSVYSRLCNDNEHLESCFRLGRIFYQNGETKDAEQQYSSGCSLGHSPSCSMLTQLNMKESIEDQKRYRERQERLQAMEVERRKEAEENQALVNAFTTMQNAFQPKPTQTLENSAGPTFETIDYDCHFKCIKSFSDGLCKKKCSY